VFAALTAWRSQKRHVPNDKPCSPKPFGALVIHRARSGE
jgi:hypothetical protein